WRAPPRPHPPRPFPQPAGTPDRVDAGLPPPRALVAGAMYRAMMPAAEWNRELIADLAAKRAGLGESKMVWIGGLAAAQQTRLLGDVAQVLPVAIAMWLRDREHALVDALRLIGVDAVGSGIHLRLRNLRHRRLTI